MYASKGLQREEYWYKELATICPYGRNDNVRREGNISKKGIYNTVVWGTLFNKKARKFKERPVRHSRQHRTTKKDMETTLRNLIRHHCRSG